jgi:hypothetical protein
MNQTFCNNLGSGNGSHELLELHDIEVFNFELLYRNKEVSYSCMYEGVFKSFRLLHLVPRSKNAWRYTSTPPVRFHGVVLNLKKAQGQLYLYVMVYIIPTMAILSFVGIR